MSVYQEETNSLKQYLNNCLRSSLTISVSTGNTIMYKHACKLREDECKGMVALRKERIPSNAFYDWKCHGSIPVFLLSV